MVWQPGQSGNPAGRPKGSRNKLGEKFVEDMLADWEEHGKAVIETVRAEKPDQYLKVIASLLPKDVNLNINDNAELTDDELVDRIRALTEAVAPLLADRTGADEAALGAQEGAVKPSSVH